VRCAPVRPRRDVLGHVPPLELAAVGHGEGGADNRGARQLKVKLAKATL
jgi:hypothetical protein